MKHLVINSHGRDCNDIEVVYADGRACTSDLTVLTHGYVPRGLGIGGDDDVSLTIDIETGMVVGWDAAKVKARIIEMLAEDEAAE